MKISLSKRTENNIHIIDFIHLGDKIGQLVYEITDNKAIIHDTFMYPDYRNKKILKTYLPTIISGIKLHRVTSIGLSVLSEEAKISWIHLGFTETKPNFLTMNI